MNRLMKIKAPLFIFILGCLVLYFFYITVSVPHIGIFVKEVNGLFIVESAEMPGKAKTKGIVEGDEIISIDGKSPKHNFYVSRFTAVEQVSNLTVKHRNGEVETIEFERNWTKKMTSYELVFQFILPWMFLLIFVAMSIFLYRKGKKDQTTFTLIFFFLTVGVTYFCSTASYRSDPIAKLALYILLPMIPYFFMHFMNLYLNRYNVKFINQSIYKLLLGLHLTSSVTYSVLVVVDENLYEYFQIFRTLMYVFISLGYLICLFSLIQLFLSYRKTQLNALFKIMLVSHAAAFTPFVTMNLIPLMLFKFELLPSTFTTLFIFALPLSFMYLFTSNTLFDIDFILTRFKYYNAIASIPAIVIMFFITIIENINYEQTWIKWFQVFFVIYAGVTLFLYLKEYIDNRARPKLFKQMYNFQDSIDRFSAQMTRVMKRSDLEELLDKELSMMLPLSHYVFLTFNRSTGIIEPQDARLQEANLAEALTRSAESFKVASIHEAETGLILVIGKRKELFHLIWIGNKSNHTHFNVDELRFLKSITHFTSIVHENLYLIENLLEDLESEMQKEKTTSPWILRLLFCLSENERRRLASDLHDSALQDQLLWYRRLETAMIDYEMSGELHDELGNIREGLLDVIYQIRETCNELRPPLLKELGLTEAIESLIEHIQLQVNFAVRFMVEPLHVDLNEEQITSIYRIVQELLRNTSKHARANLVRIELKQKDNYIYLNYKDDGVGMDINKMKASFTHMGLSGLRERVSSLEGNIEFVSSKGKGFEVQIIIPTAWTKGRGEREGYIDSYLIS